ncbi:MAG: YihA family ribosome biogenesis GTP-binding protein [Clostridiales bacterium]|nr:YihA family ribosome biogenesis GTP-binding protein [Clostridiales bacterium]
MKLNLHNVEFVKSAADPSGFISDGLPQIVFAGKSNVGKSSVINCVLNRKNFARVGATPGRTVHINYFKVDRKAYFVDLPGYGFARVSDAEKKRWAVLMETFFRENDSIALGVLIVDARHEPTADDKMMARWFLEYGRPMVVLANKVDKLNKTEALSCPARIGEALGLPEGCTVLPFSAEKGTNRGALISMIEKIP